MGGTEHATGHLIYSRFWNKFLFDLGYVCEDEPFKKLINQGMIQGRSNFVYRIVNTNTFVSLGLKDQYETTEIHVDVNIVRNDRLDLEAFKAWRPEFATAEFILENGEYVCGFPITFATPTARTPCACTRCSSARWSRRNPGAPTASTV